MSRLERILVKLAQRHAPHLLHAEWDNGLESNERITQLARRLADYGILVIVGEAPPELRNTKRIHVEDWVQNHARLYYVLANGIWPSLEQQIEAYYADENEPFAVVLQGTTAPVTAMMAGYLIPYIAIRQADKAANRFEMRGLLDVVLMELEATDIQPYILHEVRENAVEALGHLLNAQIEHIPLTEFDAGAAGVITVQQPQPQPATPEAPPPPELPEQNRPQPEAPPQVEQAAADPPPVTFDLDTLEDDDPEAFTPTEEMFSVNLPLPRSNSKRLPPVPRLPDEDDD